MSSGTRRQSAAATQPKASFSSLNSSKTLNSTNRGLKPNPCGSRKVPSTRKTPAAEKLPVPPNIGLKRASSCPRVRSPSPSQIIRVFRDPSSKRTGSTEKLSATKTPSDSKENIASLSETIRSDGKFRDPIKPDANSRSGSSSVKRADTPRLENPRSCSKQSSKLHEKLAFLEGKVKKIASDIKKTKEMLDLGNPESSKQILLNIQDNMEKLATNMDDESQSPKKATTEPPKLSIKLLNSAELESRLFPHHKLLRNRIVACSQETIESKPNEGTVQDPESSDIALTSDEKFDDWDDGKAQVCAADDGMEDDVVSEAKTIGTKKCRGGWFISEGESVILAHDDGSCTFHDITNGDEKSVYKPPAHAPPDIWGDCWVVRAAGSDGAASKFVVAASAWRSAASGFCSWDFYSKQIRAFHVEREEKRPVLAPLPANISQKRNSLSSLMSSDLPRWWYRPCGALVAATCGGQRVVKMFDVRDGEPIMDWHVTKPVAVVDFWSPIQWRNRGKLVVAESEALSVWDVNSQLPMQVQSVASGNKITALHVSNTDEEPGGGVRRRVSEGDQKDGVFCAGDSVSVVDLRVSGGVGAGIATRGCGWGCAYARGDAVYVGGSGRVVRYSIREQKEVAAYDVEGDVAQVWGDGETVLAATASGLFVFDAIGGEDREIVGGGYLCNPSFDYISSQVLLVSKDRPAMYKTLAFV